jgi:hypothetical protein
MIPTSDNNANARTFPNGAGKNRSNKTVIAKFDLISIVTNRICVPSWKRGSRMKGRVDFHLAGYTAACRNRAVSLYRRAIDTVVPVSSYRMAEATKLLENIFRSVNTALVNG